MRADVWLNDELCVHSDPDSPCRVSGKVVYMLPEQNPIHEDVSKSLEAFVFPRGLELCREKKKPFLHSFVMTIGDGQFLFGFCYIQYVPLERALTEVLERVRFELHRLSFPRIC